MARDKNKQREYMRNWRARKGVIYRKEWNARKGGRSVYEKKLREEKIRLGLCTRCGLKEAASGSSRCEVCIATTKVYNATQRARYRSICLEAYGSKCNCPYCDITNPKFFELDHINNDGIHDRKQSSARSLWSWAVRHGCPNTLQILCANCHNVKTYYGGCTAEDHKNAQVLNNAREE